MTAPREVSTTDRPSAWGRIRSRPRLLVQRRPGSLGEVREAEGQPGRVEPGALLDDQAAEIRVAADLGPQLRPGHDVRVHAHGAHPVHRPVEGSRVGRGRREDEVAGALELGVDRGRAQALDVLERLDGLAVQRLGALDAVQPTKRGQRLLEPRVAEAAVAGGGAPADPLRLEQDDVRAQLGGAPGRRQAHQSPADDHDVDRVGKVATAPVGRVGHRRLPERARVHVPQLGDRGHRVRG